MSTFIEQLCPQCNAPLPARAATGVMHCEYCAAELVPGYGALRLVRTRDEDLPDPHNPRLWIGGRRYVVTGLLARGEGSDVFLGRWDHRLSERVVIKVLRDEAQRPLFDAAWDTLTRLQRSTQQGHDHFTGLLPQPVTHGEARLGIHGTEGIRRVSVVRYAPGFVHTFEDVRREHPGGVSPEAAVWLWKRIVEVLSWVHSTRQVHGAVLPEHLLVHARDHGVRLVGWSRSVPAGIPLAAFSAHREAFYPDALWRGGPATPAADLAMGARCVRWVLEGTPAPGPLDDLLSRCAAGRLTGDGWSLLETISQTAQQLFGPPRYAPLAMPGWHLTSH